MEGNIPQTSVQTKSKSKVKVAVAIAGLLAAAAIVGYLSLKFDIIKIQDPVLIKDPATMFQEDQNLPPIYSGQ